MLMKKPKTWIVVADSAKARIFFNEGLPFKPRQVAELDSEAARQHTRDLISDRAGRSFNSVGPGRAAMEAPSDPQDVEKHKFVRDLVDYLTAASERETIDEIVLVAAPRTLGEIRKLAPPALHDMISKELAKDLTNVSMAGLRRNLASLEIGKPPLR